MIVEETFYRPGEQRREARWLPAATYNLAHRLVSQAANGCLFIPIRSMQFLAVLDREEFIFVDREQRRWIAVSWQRFRPGERTALDGPVPYEAVGYRDDAAETQRRLQGEFLKALREIQGREPARGSARVVALNRPPAC
jgi:hypothetical protein